MLRLEVDQTAVCSPDTVTGLVRAEDPDGLDSLWVRLDDSEQGLDGLLQTVLEARFQVPVRPGLGPGLALELRARARDLAGFTDTTSRILQVVRCTATT